MHYALCALQGLFMGEIKSSLELAMEKTKKFIISEKEKEEMKQKEVLQKATSLFHRYRDGLLSLNEILRQIERMEKETATTVKKILLSQWVNALSLDDEEERILKGIESLEQRNIDEIKQKFRYLVSQYQGEKEKVKEKARLQMIADLRKDGIYGSAVEPRLKGSGLWKREIEKLNHSYKMKLEEIKEQLTQL
jgi:hypothetical protein